MKIRIATRQSPLALWQANFVANALRQTHETIEVELVKVTTKVEKDLTIPICDFAGKGAFTKGVQRKVLDGSADIAVHSAKDMQVCEIEGLSIGAYPIRGAAEDVMVGSTLGQLANGATVATGSSRRKAQLLASRPDLNIVELRGNIDKRLDKLAEVDAIIMAGCALDRLDKKPEIVDLLSMEHFVPQVGQGALAVECRTDDELVGEALAKIDSPEVRIAVEAERDFLSALGGDCDLPAGSHANVDGNGNIEIRGFLANEVTTAHSVVTNRVSSAPGAALAKELLELLGSDD